MKKALLFLLVAGACPVAAAEPSLRKSAAAVLAKHGDALATVRMVVVKRTLYQKKEVHKSEYPVEIAGAVVSGNGLIVLSASALDFLPDVPVEAPLNDEAMTSEIERKGARIRFAGGKEVAAQYLGRDSSRDLAFLRPMEKLDGLAYLSLDKGHFLEAADPAIVLYPLTRLLHRRPAAMMRSVSAVSDKLAVLDSSELRLLGCPVFSAAGEFADIATTLRPPQKPHEMSSNFENLEPDIVVMDAAAVRAAAENVRKNARR